MDYDRNDALLHWLFRQTQGDAWFRPNEENISSAVALRISGLHNPVPEFRVFPYENPTLEPFEVAVTGLNPVVAVKVRSAAVHAALATVAPEDQSIYVDADTRIQVLDTMLLLPAAEKDQCAAFIRDERVLIIWSESLDRIIPICTDFEERLIKLLWRAQPNSNSLSFSPSNSGSRTHGSLISGRSSIEGSSEAFAAAVPTSASLGIASGPSPQVPNPRKSLSFPQHLHQRTSPPPQGENSKQGNSLPPPPPTSSHGHQSHTYTQPRVKRNWYGRIVARPLTSEHPLYAHHERESIDNVDIEKAMNNVNRKGGKRKMAMYAPIYNGVAAGLSVVIIGNGIKILLQEWMLDGDATRFALLVLIPMLYCISLFFTLQLVQNLSMVIGPIEQYYKNSTYYSAQKPCSNNAVDDALPHVTIQMPVYKESLETVLAPSIYSLKKAMQTYARQGGTSSIFVNDDGLRLIPPPARDARIAFYALHGIAWVARPAHGHMGEEWEGQEGTNEKQSSPQVEEKGKGKNNKGKEKESETNGVGGDMRPFLRAGRFKKASNMNYALALTLKLERHLHRLLATSGNNDPSPPATIGNSPKITASNTSNADHRNSSGGTTTESGEIMEENRDVRPPSRIFNPGPISNTNTAAPTSLEDQALALAIEEMWEESGRQHKPWAANARAARMGEIVLLVDSDTVVPEDCLRDAAREMGECPEVAIIQHESDVMQVAHHYFENGISYFTKRINRCISISCANGEVAPFMGHNAFLRWRAIQDVAFVDPTDGREKVWSESNVSEDFDMALRLMLRGYIVRWATYSKGGFKEGVSLSVDDELNRWQKYAYGCSELLFNPFVKWLKRGPIARQIHKFIWCSAPLHYKISMLSYMFSYYGIAAAITISIINYILLGFQFGVDGFYLHSFEIWLATNVVFFGSGTVGYSILQYRTGQSKLIPAFFENLTWIPFFFLFFGGLSIPLSQAILAHMFSYNISWSATIKEVQRSNFFKEIPKIAKRFWFPMSFSFILILGVIICGTSLVPLQWRIDGNGWAVIFPVCVLTGCHILFPIVLNPWLMVFSY